MDTTSGGFFPSGYNFGGNDAGSVPSIYSPFMAAGMETQKRNCHPLKISMIQQAHKNSNRLVVDGQEVAVFKVVGFLSNFEVIEDGGAEKFSFDLSDSTGTIKVDWLVGIKSEPNSTWLRNDLASFEELAQNSYVKVFGESNTRGVYEPRIKAASVHRVTDFHEIFYHDLDVIWTHVYFMGPPLSVKLDEVRRTVNPQTVSSPPKLAPQDENMPKIDPSKRPHDVEKFPKAPTIDEEDFAPKEQPKQNLFAPSRVSTGNRPEPPQNQQQNIIPEDDDDDDDDDDDADIDTTISRYLQASKAASPQGVSIKIIVRHTGRMKTLLEIFSQRDTSTSCEAGSSKSSQQG